MRARLFMDPPCVTRTTRNTLMVSHLGAAIVHGGQKGHLRQGWLWLLVHAACAKAEAAYASAYCAAAIAVCPVEVASSHGWLTSDASGALRSASCVTVLVKANKYCKDNPVGWLGSPNPGVKRWTFRTIACKEKGLARGRTRDA